MSVGRFVCISIYVGLLFVTPAYALENCVTPPTCDELGFTVNIEDCAGAALKCPWDLSKAACRVKSAEVPLPILYGDGTVDKKIFENKTPIGIVFDETNRLALALIEVNSSTPIGNTPVYWSNNYCDIPELMNCQYDYGNIAIDSCSADGQTNTAVILATNDDCSGRTIAAIETNLYQPQGCSTDFCKKNQWFLPSMRDLAKIYVNKSTINTCLSLLNSFGAKTLIESYYWSSNEYNRNYAWNFHMRDGYRGHCLKNVNDSYVRPVIKY